MSGKPGKPGKPEDGRPDEGASSSRLDELRAKVSDAAERIAELRETNYSLKSELADLSGKLAALEGAAARESASEPQKPEVPEVPEVKQRSGPGADSHDRERLELLLQERKAIRSKIEKLVERVERIES